MSTYMVWKCILFVHKDLKGSLTRDFRGKLIDGKNLKLKTSCQTPFKGRPRNTILCTGEILTGRTRASSVNIIL